MNARRYTSVVALVCVLLVVLLSAGCELIGGEDDSEKHIVEVHLQGGFGKAHVLVTMDERVVFDDTLTGLEPFSGPVKMTMVEAREGQHHIRVSMDGINQKEATFTVDSKLYIGLQNADIGIIIRIQKTPFGYQ